MFDKKGVGIFLTGVSWFLSVQTFRYFT